MSLKGRSCWVVNIRMVRSEELSLEAMGRFVAASEEVRFEAEDRRQLYGWVEQVLVGQQYAAQGKAARGLAQVRHGNDSFGYFDLSEGSKSCWLNSGI